MNHQAIYVAIPVVSFAVDVAVQIALQRLTALGLLKSELVGFAAGIALLLGAMVSIGAMGTPNPVELVAMAAANCLIYVCLAYCYFHFVNLSVTARRIRLLRDLHQRPSGMTYEEILECYNAADMVDIRLRRLLGSGQIKVRENAYVLDKPVTVVISKVMIGLRRLLLGKRGRFEIKF